MSFFLGNLKQLVDFAATTSFLAAPVFALLNHRAIFSAEVPEKHRPSRQLQWWSYAGMILLSGFALGYLYLAFIY